MNKKTNFSQIKHIWSISFEVVSINDHYQMVCLLTVCFDDSFLPVAEVGQVCEADDVYYW
jgi:hypothetical protein